MNTWTLQGVPNGWERVPLSNPLGFKHHPLEGAGMNDFDSISIGDLSTCCACFFYPAQISV